MARGEAAGLVAQALNLEENVPTEKKPVLADKAKGKVVLTQGFTRT